MLHQFWRATRALGIGLLLAGVGSMFVVLLVPASWHRGWWIAIGTALSIVAVAFAMDRPRRQR